MKKMSVTLQTPEAEMLSKLGTKPITTANTCLENFLHLHRYTVNELKGVFIRDEIIAIVDSLNGIMYQPSWAANKGALIAHLNDSEQLDGMGKHWGIDTQKLIDKVEKLTAAQVMIWQYEVSRFWDNPARDLDKFVADFV